MTESKFHFTINEKIQEVESNLPFYYNSQNTTAKSEQEIKRKKAGNKVWVKPAGIGSISVGTVLLGAMGWFIYSAFDSDKKYSNSDEIDDANHYADKRDNAVKSAVITGGTGGLLVPAGTGLLIWEHKTKSKMRTVSVYPVTGEANGFKIVMKF